MIGRFYRTQSALGGAMAMALASRAPAETAGTRRATSREVVTKAARQQGKVEGHGGMSPSGRGSEIA